MNDSAKSALPPLVAKELAAELIRLPLLQTELALQSHDFFIPLPISCEDDLGELSLVKTALKFVARAQLLETWLALTRVSRHNNL